MIHIRANRLYLKTDNLVLIAKGKVVRNSELKQLINVAYEMAESMYLTPYGQYFAQKGVKPFKDLLMLDLVKYVSYLGNVKGIATEREVVGELQ